MSSNLAALRTEYKLKSLKEEDANPDAIGQFATWWKEASESDIPEVNAMTLCTVNADGKPDGRIVLLKGYDANGFSFFTNYNSRKGMELSGNGHASLVFFWKELERQVRISGMVNKLSAEESDDYFKVRPRNSQLGAWASNQSTLVSNREELLERLAGFEEKFSNQEVPRPPHWGGYLLSPDTIEFWQGRPSRLHDRLLYTRNQESWTIDRLAP